MRIFSTSDITSLRTRREHDLKGGNTHVMKATTCTARAITVVVGEKHKKQMKNKQKTETTRVLEESPRIDIYYQYEQHHHHIHV